MKTNNQDLEGKIIANLLFANQNSVRDWKYMGILPMGDTSGILFFTNKASNNLSSTKKGSNFALFQVSAKVVDKFEAEVEDKNIQNTIMFLLENTNSKQQVQVFKAMPTNLIENGSEFLKKCSSFVSIESNQYEEIVEILNDKLEIIKEYKSAQTNKSAKEVAVH